jgi:hypothetical protein
LIALGDNSTVGKLSYYVPGLNAIRTPVRTLCLYHVGVGILAAAGVDVLLLALRRLPLRLALSLATVPALVLTVEAGANASRHLQTRSDPLYPLVYYSDPWMLEKSRLTLAEPGAAYRLMALPNEATPPNLGNVNGSLSIRGHRATMQMRYFKYLRRDWSPAGESFRHLGLRYVFSREPLPQPMILLDSRNGLSFYERPDALSVFQVVEVDSVRSARLESINWAHNDVRLILAKGESGRVVFAQARYPGWTAKLDGETVPIVKEDAFISVNVPPGARELVFAYRPWWLVPGIALALGALVVAVITATRASFSTSHPSSGP